MDVITQRLQVDKEVLKKQIIEFTGEITDEKPEWTKQRRLDYLNVEQIKLKEKLRGPLAVIGKSEPWFSDVVKEMIQPLVKQFVRNKREISSWILPRYNSNWIEQNDIALATDVSYSEYIEIKRHDHNRDWALCPFHNEKTPSFCISKDNNKFHCFGCGEHGDLIDLIKKLYGMEFLEAVKFILKK